MGFGVGFTTVQYGAGHRAVDHLRARIQCGRANGLISLESRMLDRLEIATHIKSAEIASGYQMQRARDARAQGSTVSKAPAPSIKHPSPIPTSNSSRPRQPARAPPEPRRSDMGRSSCTLRAPRPEDGGECVR